MRAPSAARVWHIAGDTSTLARYLGHSSRSGKRQPDPKDDGAGVPERALLKVAAPSKCVTRKIWPGTGIDGAMSRMTVSRGGNWTDHYAPSMRGPASRLVSTARRWWPVPVILATSLTAQKVLFESRYD